MISKREAGYVDHPVAGRRCAACVMFRQPNRCTLVSGSILPDGHCQYWEPKDTVKLTKVEPGPGAVHVTTALGNQQPRRYRPFVSIIGQPRKQPVSPPQVGPQPVRTATSGKGAEARVPTNPPRTFGPSPVTSATTKARSFVQTMPRRTRSFNSLIRQPARPPMGPTVNGTPVRTATSSTMPRMVTGPRIARPSQSLSVTPTRTATSRPMSFAKLLKQGDLLHPATPVPTALDDEPTEKRYATTADLPKPVRDRFKGRPKKLRQFLHVWNGEYDAHGDEKRAFATAWAAVQKAGMLPPMQGEKGRTLHALNDHAYHVPFTYDPHFWGSLTAEDEPRFLGAITHPKDLPKAKVPLSGLRAIQNRVNSEDIQRHVDNPSKKRPVIVKFRGNHYIGDGHDRLTARWLRGKKDAKVRLFDLDNADASPQNKAWSTPFKIEKADPDKQQVFGWASVVTKNGVPVIDKQDDIIPVDELEKAAYQFMLESRRQGDMHARTEGVGRLIESCVFSVEKQRSLNIDLGFEGWWVGFLCDCKDLWKDIRSGRKLQFSIGGSAISEKSSS